MEEVLFHLEDAQEGASNLYDRHEPQPRSSRLPGPSSIRLDAGYRLSG
jgi:hypothetical protein